jgi:hypothetical protein
MYEYKVLTTLEGDFADDLEIAMDNGWEKHGVDASGGLIVWTMRRPVCPAPTEDT